MYLPTYLVVPFKRGSETFARYFGHLGMQKNVFREQIFFQKENFFLQSFAIARKESSRHKTFPTKADIENS